MATNDQRRNTSAFAAFETSQVHWTRELELRRAAVARWRGTEPISCERQGDEEERN